MTDLEKKLFEAAKEWAIAPMGWQERRAEKEFRQAAVNYRQSQDIYQDWVADNYDHGVEY